MMVSDQEMDALLKRLNLANTRRTWRELARRAEQEDWTYQDFFVLLVTEEIAHRQQTRLERVVRRARFPFLKTIDDFNFMYQSTVRLSLLGSALSADFTTEGHCLIFNGKPGRGKTHLAIAIAYRAIQRGRFLTLDGPSMRTKHLGIDDPTAPEASAQSASRPGDVIRISGIDAPEFPEPTAPIQSTRSSSWRASTSWGAGLNRRRE